MGQVAPEVDVELLDRLDGGDKDITGASGAKRTWTEVEQVRVDASSQADFHAGGGFMPDELLQRNEGEPQKGQCDDGKQPRHHIAEWLAREEIGKGDALDRQAEDTRCRCKEAEPGGEGDASADPVGLREKAPGDRRRGGSVGGCGHGGRLPGRAGAHSCESFATSQRMVSRAGMVVNWVVGMPTPNPVPFPHAHAASPHARHEW